MRVPMPAHYHFAGLIFPDAHTHTHYVLSLFRGFKFRARAIIRENRENWTLRKFPAILSALGPGSSLVWEREKSASFVGKDRHNHSVTFQ